MNLYFLVEGNSTEKKVYPAWLAYLLPELQRVKNYDEVVKNNYYLISGEGNPSIYNHIPNAIEEIRSVGKYDYLVICLDAEERNVTDSKQEIYDLLQSKNIDMGNTQLAIIIQNRCIETWFLGNRKIYLRNPQSIPLLDCTRFYDVSVNCPELMGKYDNFNTHAQFHKHYLRKLVEAKNISYSEKRPGDVMEQFYLKELLKRIEDKPEHLPTFKEFIQFCNMIKAKLQ